MGAPPPQERPPIPHKRPELTLWKKTLIGVASTFLVIGGCLQAFGSTGETLEPGPNGSNASPNTLVAGEQQPGSANTETVTADSGTKGWSPFFLKGGFSFLVAFTVGFAARVWLKIAALILGSFFLGVFLLSYVKALSVDWSTLEIWWNSIVERASSEGQDFKTFLTGSLPQAGMAFVGLVTGFKQR